MDVEAKRILQEQNYFKLPFDCMRVVEMYECRKCNYATSIKFCLLRHKHHLKSYTASESELSYKCDYCDFETYSALLFLKHKRSSHYLKSKFYQENDKISMQQPAFGNYVIKKEQCNEEESSVNNIIFKDTEIKKEMRDTIEKLENEIGEINQKIQIGCEDFGSLTNVQNLTVKQDRIIKDIQTQAFYCPNENVTCPFCEYVSTNICDWRKHIRENYKREDHGHLIILPKLCGQIFATNYKEFITYVDSCSPRENSFLKCNICFFECKFQRSMQKHFLACHFTGVSYSVTNNSYQCLYCSFTTKIGYMMENHLWSHRFYVNEHKSKVVKRICEIKLGSKKKTESLNVNSNRYNRGGKVNLNKIVLTTVNYKIRTVRKIIKLNPYVNAKYFSTN